MKAPASIIGEDRLCDNGKLEMVEGASHWLHIEQPERINTRVIEFLAEGH